MMRDKKYLCAFFPHWSTDVTERRLKQSDTAPDAANFSKPILLTATYSQQVVVERFCKKAESLGVKRGSPLPLALAMATGAYVEAFDALRDFKAIKHLAAWCSRFSPLVGLDYELLDANRSGALSSIGRAHYGIILDLTGTERLHGNLPRLASHLQALFKYKAKIALAPTIGCAWAISRYSMCEQPIVVPSQAAIESAIAYLPVRSFRISNDTVKLLSDVGIFVASDLISLPKRSLAKRFGKHLLYRVEQCLGLIEERLHTVEAPKTFNSRRRFEPPISRRSSVVFASRYLFEDLLLQLGLANKRAKYFHITIEESDGRSTKKELALASATSDFIHFFSVVEPIIEGMNFSEEVSCIEVSARDIEDARSEQKSLSSHESEGFADSRQREELLNNFAVRIGKDRVLRALLHQSYVPERSYSYDSMLNESPVEALAERSLPYTLDERPSIIYPHPEPISTIAMLPDRPPSFVHWKSRKLKVLSGIGPERIAPEWWIGDLLRQQFAERDYFKIQDEFGRWLWVYRDQKTLEWFVHGLWT